MTVSEQIWIHPSSEKVRARSDILSNVLSGKVTSVTAAEFCGAVIPSDLHVPENSAVVHLKNTRLEQFVFYLDMWKISRVFMSHNSAELHWTFHFKILYYKLQTKALNSTCRTILVCKLSQIVNFDGFWTLMVWHFWQLLSCTANQIIWTILTGILIGLL